MKTENAKEYVELIEKKAECDKNIVLLSELSWEQISNINHLGFKFKDKSHRYSCWLGLPKIYISLDDKGKESLREFYIYTLRRMSKEISERMREIEQGGY